MKKTIISVAFLVLLAVAILTAGVAQGAFYTTEQVMNKVLNNDKMALRIDTGATLEVNLKSYDNTVLKRITLSPNTDSGDDLSFGTQVSKWMILNISDTAEIYIKFESAATINDFKLPAGMGISYDSKVTTIHAISQDTAEVEAIGLH